MTDAPRKPRVFKIDDPGLKEITPPPDTTDHGPEPTSQAAPPSAMPARFDLDRGIRWGSLLFAALTAASSLALTIWFYRLVSVAIWQDDWIGWTLRILVGVAAFAALMLLLRELFGFFRLKKLGKLKTEVTAAIATPTAKGDQAIAARLLSLYGKRPELRWQAQKLTEHTRDVHDPGALLHLADRDLMPEIDGAARRLITAAARRVAMVTAFSPFAMLAFGFVAVENIRMIRKVAEIYGGRPGFAASVGLTRRVILHLLASGSLALTDDLLGQFIGQGVLQRLSRRLGEGVFNGTVTARVGVAAIDVLRPLPYLAARPVRARDIVAEALSDLWGSTKKGDGMMGRDM